MKIFLVLYEIKTRAILKVISSYNIMKTECFLRIFQHILRKHA